MTSKNTAGLKAAAQIKAEKTRLKVEKALRQMRKNHEPISISSVAAAAEVSRTYLQQHPDFKERIKLLGENTTRAVVSIPTSSDNSVIAALRHQITAINKQHKQETTALRHEIRRLESALAQAHGSLMNENVR